MPLSDDRQRAYDERLARLAASRKLHSELVDRAARWLKNTQKCTVVLTEQSHGWASEILDAMGWTRDRCIVVECKTSLADLRKDGKKQHTKEGSSMGDERWYLVPPGIVTVEQLPFGHGLLEIRGKTIRVLRPAPQRDVTWRRLRSECEFLRVELCDSWRKIRAKQAAEAKPKRTRLKLV